jgi:hypothetical protein
MLSIDCAIAVWELKIGALTNESVIDTRVPGENHRPVASHWQTLSVIVVSSTPQDSNSQH